MQAWAGYAKSVDVLLEMTPAPIVSSLPKSEVIAFYLQLPAATGRNRPGAPVINNAVRTIRSNFLLQAADAAPDGRPSSFKYLQIPGSDRFLRPRFPAAPSFKPTKGHLYHAGFIAPATKINYKASVSLKTLNVFVARPLH